MGRADDSRSRDAEWLDPGHVDVLDSMGRPGRRWSVVLLLVVAGLIAALLYPTLRHAGTPSAAPAPTAPTAGRSSPAGGYPGPAVASQPVTVTEVGHRLLGVTAGWELFGRGPGAVVRIQPALGRITRTEVPGLQSSGPVSFTVGADGVIIRPLDLVAGYAVPDGQPARELRGALSRHGPVFAGPDAGHVWVETDVGDHKTMVLVGMDGRPTHVSIRIPGDSAGYVASDGAGYLLVTSTGGVYDARPDGLRRVTTGVVLAAGPTRWLTVECEDQHRCATVVIDRVSGARRVLAGVPAAVNSAAGVISPDGSMAVVLPISPAGTATLHLVDLGSGADHPLAVTTDRGSFNDGTLVWSPDSRRLFVAAAGGRLLVVDAYNGAARDLGVALPHISQVGVRSRPQ